MHPPYTMSSHHREEQERDGFRRMSGEDEMMFNNPTPFTAEVRYLYLPASPSLSREIEYGKYSLVRLLCNTNDPTYVVIVFLSFSRLPLYNI